MPALWLALSAPALRADEPLTSEAERAQLWQQIQAQQAELEGLQNQLQACRSAAESPSFQTISLERHDSAAIAPEPNAPYEVGSDLKMSARWEPNTGIVFSTANKDFVSHIGVRTQVDFVGFNESSSLAHNPKFGPLEDGEYFRRLRPSWDGTAYDLMEWQVQFALEQFNNNIPNLNEVWVGVKSLPYVNTVRIGHIRVEQGFESGQFSADKVGTVMETSMGADAFMQVLGSGVWITNSIADQHLTWAAQAYKQDALNNNTGADFADGAWGYTGRVTVLPFYQDDGRHMLHLGVSGTFRDAQPTALGGPAVTQFRARPELRDQDGSTPLGNANRLVDTGAIASESNGVVGSELLYILGPASLQAEYNFAQINDAVIGTTRVGDLPFEAGYIQLSYILTGEHRLYDRRLGRLGPNYCSGPFTPFWLVRDENGDCCWGSGAWELHARYSHISLDDHAVSGGQSDAYTYGLNWYLNASLNIRLEYLHQVVYGGGPLGDGVIDGIGMRTQFFF
ncbi:MAG TPA: porin [Pirellulales bacterium]|jgi:phosphate-selective porin OprO/OprP|nr:porin [Pirellulales bacterium]